MAIWHAVELVIGRFFLQRVFEEALTCGANGTEWHYRSGLAHLFLVLHIMGTVQSLGTHRKIFINAAKDAGIVPRTKKDLKKLEKAEQKEAKKEAKKDQ